ncbi:hypothetical protein M5K25_002418 [Dendrobium thyrsiflorum]|uniref:Uncharacterized protein n=1 Tax=Dendrobium thyrsiflorum TaxID=117978 RepID=A0ABD0VM42_DENTH
MVRSGRRSSPYSSGETDGRKASRQGNFWKILGGKVADVWDQLRESSLGSDRSPLRNKQVTGDPIPFGCALDLEWISSCVCLSLDMSLCKLTSDCIPLIEAGMNAPQLKDRPADLAVSQAIVVQTNGITVDLSNSGADIGKDCRILNEALDSSDGSEFVYRMSFLLLFNIPPSTSLALILPKISPVHGIVGKFVNQQSMWLHLGMLISPTYFPVFTYVFLMQPRRYGLKNDQVSKTCFPKEHQRLGPITDLPMKQKEGSKDVSH